MLTIRALSSFLLFCSTSQAQQVGTNTREVHPALTSKTCTKMGGCRTDATKIVLDANWRWLHHVGGYTNCFTGNSWDARYCTDPNTCAENCALEGADYSSTYGIQASGNSLQLKFVTQGPSGKNVGARVYLMEDDQSYKMFKLLNQEFTFDVDVSHLPCGINGALYFSEMPSQGGLGIGNNQAGAAYGTGYCDAQCPRDIKFINGKANLLGWNSKSRSRSRFSVTSTGASGACCNELDIWEANSISQAYTPHPCSVKGLHECTSPEECGDGSNRYNGVCDKDGCDFNPFRMGNRTFYGPGSHFTLDSTKPMTVVTQFITNDGTSTGELIEIRRLYKQHGKVIYNSNTNLQNVEAASTITDKLCSQVKDAFGDINDFGKKGKLKVMGESLQRGIVLAMSIWDDHAAHLLWLDSNYPREKDPSTPGVARGTCPTSSGVPREVEEQYPNAYVKYMNIRVGDINSTY